MKEIFLNLTFADELTGEDYNYLILTNFDL